jgi:serine/threonine protein kinase
MSSLRLRAWILHCDMKSYNTMLDDDMNPHLGNFGLAYFIHHNKLGKTTFDMLHLGCYTQTQKNINLI